LQALPVEETIDLNDYGYLRKPLGILLDHLLRMCTLPMCTSDLDHVLRQPLGLTAAPRPLQPPAEDRAPEVARFWWEAGLGDVREVLCFWWEAGLGDVADERLLRLFDYDRPPQRDSIVECCLYKPRADALKQRTRGGAAPWPDYAPILDVTPSAWPLLSDLSRQPLAWQPRWLRRMGSRSWQFDPEQVADLALRHPDPLVRAEAVLRAYVSSHSDRDHIVGLSLDDPHWWVNRIADFLRKHAEPPIGGSGSERIAEIKQIQEPAALAAIACDAEASVAERWHAARQLAPLIQSGLFVAPGQLGPAR
jgi:hypothetical protein